MGYPEYGLLVRFAAFTGLRAGELVALRVRDLELLQRRVQVSMSASEGGIRSIAVRCDEDVRAAFSTDPTITDR